MIDFRGGIPKTRTTTLHNNRSQVGSNPTKHKHALRRNTENKRQP